jgi:hypothetical protein
MEMSMQPNSPQTGMTDAGTLQPDALRQPHTLIASDRVEGTPVRRGSGEKIGTIERLMIDKLSGNVAYAVLSFGGFLGMGQKHAPIPWARLSYDRTLGAYRLEISDDELIRAPTVRSTITIACPRTGAPTDRRRLDPPGQIRNE